MRAQLCLAAAPPRSASQERRAANRTNARPLAAPAAASARSFEAALNLRQNCARYRSFGPSVGACQKPTLVTVMLLGYDWPESSKRDNLGSGEA